MSYGVYIGLVDWYVDFVIDAHVDGLLDCKSQWNIKLFTCVKEGFFFLLELSLCEAIN